MTGADVPFELGGNQVSEFLDSAYRANNDHPNLH